MAPGPRVARVAARRASNAAAAGVAMKTLSAAMAPAITSRWVPGRRVARNAVARIISAATAAARDAKGFVLLWPDTSPGPRLVGRPIVPKDDAGSGDPADDRPAWSARTQTPWRARKPDAAWDTWRCSGVPRVLHASGSPSV